MPIGADPAVVLAERMSRTWNRLFSICQWSRRVQQARRAPEWRVAARDGVDHLARAAILQLADALDAADRLSPDHARSRRTGGFVRTDCVLISMQPAPTDRLRAADRRDHRHLARSLPRNVTSDRRPNGGGTYTENIEQSRHQASSSVGFDDPGRSRPLAVQDRLDDGRNW